MKLGKNFFARNAEIVAKELLGKIIIRKIGEKILKARIVETEAYFGPEDPASRARQKGDLRDTMLMDPGTILVYGVHNNWLVNFVTNKKGKAEAVLIRALEPLNFTANTKGPGLLTRALKINKKIHKENICNNEGCWIEDSKEKYKIGKSFRIGVKKDLSKKFRFYINNNIYVSRK